MKRILQILATAALPIGIALTVVPSAQAQPVDCGTHVLDATASQGIAADFIDHGIARLQEIAPTADVYVQAYEQIPGGSVAAFWDTAMQQCANWHAADSDRAKDELMVVVYGRDVDDVGFFYGYGFEAVAYPYHEETMKAVKANLGPDTSQVDPNYAAQALAQPLLATRVHAVNSPRYYSAADGLYHMPAYTVPTGHEDTDLPALFGMIGLVIVGFVLLGIVLHFLGLILVRLFTVPVTPTDGE